jgi:uncharacterized protein YecA (UPF0149 family)
MAGRMHRITLIGKHAKHENLSRQCFYEAVRRKEEREAVEEWCNAFLESLQAADVPARVAILSLDMARWKLSEFILNRYK